MHPKFSFNPKSFIPVFTVSTNFVSDTIKIVCYPCTPIPIRSHFTSNLALRLARRSVVYRFTGDNSSLREILKENEDFILNQRKTYGELRLELRVVFPGTDPYAAIEALFGVLILISLRP